MWNFGPSLEGKKHTDTQIESAWEQSAEENLWI
jgi:hypothetical protein